MIAPVLGQPAYVLHRRPYKETSSIVELLTLEHGRVAGVMRGVRRARRLDPIEPFSRMEVGWRGNGQLVTFTSRESVHHWRISARFLFAGLYLNELLIRTLRHEEPVVELFGVYEEALGRLEIEHDLESTLRVFEKRLLRELGYELSFEVDSSTGNKLMEDVEYEFVRGAGFQPAFKSSKKTFSGFVLRRISEDQYEDEQVRRAAKLLLRQALRPHIGNKPMATKDLFRRRDT